MRHMSSAAVTGVGIGLRREHYGEILDCARPLDFLEIVPENFVGRGGRPLALLRACAERWPIAAHGVSMSLGGPDAFDQEYVVGLGGLLDACGTGRYTDHLCYAAIDGVAYHDLLPLPFTSAAARHAAARISELRDRLGRPVAVENISYYAVMPGSEKDEADFVREVIERADCELLLDVNNVYVNAINHGCDPFEMLWSLPTERAVQIHLAGHIREGERLLDNHGEAVCDPVWAMYRAVIERHGAIPTLIEWDTHIPPLGRVLDEADAARAILDQYTGVRALA
jgi:uncharacterized protein